MTRWAIVPVKPFDQGKSRLRALLTQDVLRDFNKQLLSTTLTTLQASGCFDHILVVSRDREALAYAEQTGAIALAETGEQDLNAAVREALAFIAQEDAGEVLILPTDLPFLTAEDLGMLLDYVPCEAGILIVPDLRNTGTNALFLTQPDLISPVFGCQSFLKHCKQAEEKALPIVIYHNAHIQRDIDTPEDFRAYQASISVTTFQVT